MDAMDSFETMIEDSHDEAHEDLGPIPGRCNSCSTVFENDEELNQHACPGDTTQL